jgi:CheY-like chemotaxis protein
MLLPRFSTGEGIVKTGTVLSVEDNEDDQFLLQRAWRKAMVSVNLQAVGDGEKAIEYLSGLDKYRDRELFPIPDIILLDLKMPRKNGFEVLEWMSRTLPSERPLVAVFTSSQNSADIQRAYELGARWYLMKPVDYPELIKLAQLIGRWFDNPQGNDISSLPHFRGINSR